MFSFTLAKVFITLILGKYEDTNYHFILEAASLSIRGSVIIGGVVIQLPNTVSNDLK